jgi:hypothetical protein
VDCINLAEDGEKWRAVLKTAMNLWVPQMREISGPAEGLASWGYCQKTSLHHRVYALRNVAHCEVIRGYHVQEWVKGRYLWE